MVTMSNSKTPKMTFSKRKKVPPGATVSSITAVMPSARSLKRNIV